MSFHAYSFSRLVVITGLATWLSIAVFNNLSDPGTNRFHIGNTLSMALLEEEETLGAALLWFAAFSYAQAWRQRSRLALHVARNRAVMALTCFLLLWFGFVCGGLWFGYWMKQGPIQSVHMTLILIGIGALLFVQGELVPNQAIQVIAPTSPGKSPLERSHP